MRAPSYLEPGAFQASATHIDRAVPMDSPVKPGSDDLIFKAKRNRHATACPWHPRLGFCQYLHVCTH